MKLPPFDHTRAQWDRYKAFHIWHTPSFVQFDTGELAFVGSNVRREHRRYYPEFDLTIFDSTHIPDNIKLRTPEGEEVKSTWLSQAGHQLLLSDHGSRRVVAIGRLKDNKQVPERLRKHAKAYINGLDGELVGAEVYLNKPVIEPPEVVEHLKNLRAASKAWLAMTDYTYKVYQKWPVRPSDVRDKTFADLADLDRARIAHCGFTADRKATKYPYLTC